MFARTRPPSSQWLADDVIRDEPGDPVAEAVAESGHDPVVEVVAAAEAEPWTDPPAAATG